jgi:adenylate kinase
MIPTAFIFNGPQGSGKGTQVARLKEFLKTKTPDISQLTLDTGAGFRTFSNSGSYSASLMKASIDSGDRQADFLATWVVSDFFLKNSNGNEHFFIDGFPRTTFQSEAIISILNFYKFNKKVVLNLNVSDAEVTKRLLLRGRTDDTEVGIAKRLAWYKSDVLPAIEMLKQNSDYTVIDINGEQSIEDIHKEIISKLGL